MINKLIIESLKPLGIPTTFYKYTGSANLYITFHEYFTDGEAYEDDIESLSGHYIQVDLWSKTDYNLVVNSVRTLLIKNGFKRLNESDLYEEDLKIYHKAMKFYYLEGE